MRPQRQGPHRRTATRPPLGTPRTVRSPLRVLPKVTHTSVSRLCLSSSSADVGNISASLRLYNFVIQFEKNFTPVQCKSVAPFRCCCCFFSPPLPPFSVTTRAKRGGFGWQTPRSPPSRSRHAPGRPRRPRQGTPPPCRGCEGSDASGPDLSSPSPNPPTSCPPNPPAAAEGPMDTPGAGPSLGARQGPPRKEPKIPFKTYITHGLRDESGARRGGRVAPPARQTN